MAETVFYDPNTVLYAAVPVAGILSISYNDPTLPMDVRGGDGQVTQYLPDAGIIRGNIACKDTIEAGKLSNKHEGSDVTAHVKDALGADFLLTLTDFCSGGVSSAASTPAAPAVLQFTALAVSLAAV